MIRFIARDPRATIEHMGLIPLMLSTADPRPAREQLDSAYGHGGGWQPMPNFKMTKDENLVYPGDPPTKPFAELQLRDERVVLYEHEWVAIIQRDGSFEVSRMD